MSYCSRSIIILDIILLDDGKRKKKKEQILERFEIWKKSLILGFSKKKKNRIGV